MVPALQPTANTLRQLDLNLRVDIRPLLPAIQAETPVIGCAMDHTVPVGNSRDIYAEVDTGHVGLFEKPAEFVKLIRDFIHQP
jgi:hypothetical protein